MQRARRARERERERESKRERERQLNTDQIKERLGLDGTLDG